MLLNDRFVGTFGLVPAGDRELITKVAVQAARQGFGVVPMQEDAVNPACALGVRDSKKPHDCYHVMTEDTKVRAAFNRLTKDGAVCNLAIDLGASNIGTATDVSWWNGPEISPTLVGLDGERLYLFDLTDVDSELWPEELTTVGTLLVPPSADDDDAVQLVGQLNSLTDNIPVEEEEDMASPADLWNSAREDEMNKRITDLESDMAAVKQALVVALTTLGELRQEKE